MNQITPSILPTLKPPVGSPIYDFGHKQNTVRIGNFAQQVSRNDIIALFRSHVGGACSYRDIRDDSGNYLEMTFSTRDAALEALQMNKYTICGTAITVTASTRPNKLSTKSSSDERRNLYVLGLPFDLTKNEFTATFSQFGTVSHSVILATVDNSSRRRGFVVMSTNEEAYRAMTGLTRTQIKGHIIDVSWAVVQRSQGFLDGGDRAMLLDSRCSRVSPLDHCLPEITGPPRSSSSSETGDLSLPSILFAVIPTTTILVSNLPTLLFSQRKDIYPLFYPFGEIKALEVFSDPTLRSLVVVVQYASVCIARDAKDSLDGESYASHRLEVRYIRSVFPNSGESHRSVDYLAGLNDDFALLPRNTRGGYTNYSQNMRTPDDSLHSNSGTNGLPRKSPFFSLHIPYAFDDYNVSGYRSACETPLANSHGSAYSTSRVKTSNK